MPKLKLSEILDDKPVKVTVELPAKLHRDLGAYARVLGEETGSPIADPIRLIVPMLERFITTDRGFAKARQRMGLRTEMSSTGLRRVAEPSSEQG